MRIFFFSFLMLGLSAMIGCGGSAAAASGSTATTTQAVAPAITSRAALNGAVIVTLSSTTSNAQIYYTIDGSTPTSAAQRYGAPFLVASDITIEAIAMASGVANSTITSKNFTLGIGSGTLVWSDEFTNATGANAAPDAGVWSYETGNGTSGWGNNELEYYCAYGATASPCSTTTPNAYVGTDGYLHIVAQQPSSGVYTSARLKTQGLFGFQYGRLEIRARLPEAQGLWPAGWLLGADEATVGWPACGEQDVMERVGAATTPDWNEGSIHGTGFTGTNFGTVYDFSGSATAAGWHTYGMIWAKDSVAYYVDDATAPYVTYTPASIGGLSGAAWPFNGRANFLLLNLAVGGSWSGNPDATTSFPAEMLVDSVRIYTN